MNDSARAFDGSSPSGLPYPLDPPVIRDDLPDKGPGAPASWGLRAVSWERGTLPSIQEAAIRALLPGIFLFLAVSGGPFGYLQFVPIIIYLSSLTSPVYRGWHDKAADTIVLSYPHRFRP